MSLLETHPLLKTIPPEKLPKHVLIIPDGNGRWAKQHNKPILLGHKKGSEVLKTILRDLSELPQISIVTLWGFSADNWKRSEQEVKWLLQLIQYQLEQTLKELQKRNARFIHLGRKDRLPKSLLQTIETAEKNTQQNPGQTVCLAVDFGGEDQELRIIEKARNLPKETPLTKELLYQLRDGKGLIPPADLLIRTSGEQRTSDIGWLNGAPTDLYFEPKLFPDITTHDIINAILAFSKRERRLGSRTVIPANAGIQQG